MDWVLLHEGLGSVRLWRRFPAQLREALNAPVWAADRLGHGDAPPGPTGAPDSHYHRREAARLLAWLDARGLERVCLLGHSDGGTIALLAAAALPQRIAGVVTIAAHVFNEPLTRQGIAAAREAFQQGPLRRRLYRYHGPNTEAMFRRWSRTWLHPAFARWRMTADLPAVRCPVLAIQGRDDRYGSPDQVQAICAGVSGSATPCLLPDCGHDPHLEAPERTLATIVQWRRAQPAL